MRTVVIVGSGIAGLACAIKTAELGGKAVLISPYPSERSQSVMAAGGINAALDTKGENDSVVSHIEDTLKGGCNIESREAVEGLCKAAPGIIDWLEKLGMVFTRDREGRVDLRAFGGQSHRRTAFSGACTGKQIVSALVRKARQYECSGQIERKTGLWFHSALIRDGRCYGALFYNDRTHSAETVFGDAVVMASGGQNGLFGKTTGSTLCDGYAAGKLFEQGAVLRNLEFIQYHPTTLETEQKRMLITEGTRGEGGRLFYLDGDRKVYFMEDKFGPRGNLMPRDIVSKCIYDAPSQVYLDVSFLDRDVIMGKLSEVYDLCMRYGGIDITEDWIPVYPSVHFFMGGLAVDSRHRTNIRNLYAAGECASLYHGANRLGGNSLLAALYGGITAAADIDETYKDASDKKSYGSEITCDTAMSWEPVPPWEKKKLADIMNANLGITRRKESLNAGIEAAESLMTTCDNYIFQRELLLAKAILMSAEARRETRGAHIREDYPEPGRDYQCHSFAVFKDGEIQISFDREFRKGLTKEGHHAD